MDTHAERFRRPRTGKASGSPTCDYQRARVVPPMSDRLIDREHRSDVRLQGRSRCGSGLATS